MKASFRLGRIAGIEIGIHYTWIFAFFFITWSLAVGYYPSSYPTWSTATYWGAGAAAALLLFFSVLVHELAHSFVALARGLRVQGITLFIFGGVSNIGSEAETARDEFAIAVVGPLTSLVLGGLFFVSLPLFGDPDSPLAAVVWYLAFINVLLGVFNLLPGFPLDGGRVLRSILWGALGSLMRATNIAAGVGQGFAWLLIVAGGIQVIAGGNLVGGLWIAFIGWFLHSAAGASRQQAAWHEQLAGIRVSEVMELHPETITPTATVEELVRGAFLQRGRRAAPVCVDGRLVGIVTLTDVRELSQTQWGEVRVSEVMTREPLYSVAPDDELSVALRLLEEHGLNQVLVRQGTSCAGLLSRADIIRYLRFSQELGLRGRRRLM